MTQSHENRCCWSHIYQLSPGSLVTLLSIDVTNGQVGWCSARLHDHDAMTAILTMQLSAGQLWRLFNNVGHGLFVSCVGTRKLICDKRKSVRTESVLTILSPHHKRFTALFPGPPSWAGARRELLDFMLQGKINRGRHTDHPAGSYSIRTNQCPPPPPPHIIRHWN